MILLWDDLRMRFGDTITGNVYFPSKYVSNAPLKNWLDSTFITVFSTIFVEEMPR